MQYEKGKGIQYGTMEELKDEVSAVHAQGVPVSSLRWIHPERAHFFLCAGGGGVGCPHSPSMVWGVRYMLYGQKGDHIY